MPQKLEETYDVRSSMTKIIEANVKRKMYGVRHLQVLMFFALLAIEYGQRSILSVAIVAMVDNSSNHRFQTFDWDTKQQSYILSSFYWGYFMTQIPSGPLAQRFGVKWMLLISAVSVSILTILTPVGVSIGGWKLLCGIRVVMGIMQGCLFPCLVIFATKWIPLPERGKLLSFCYSGGLIGVIASMSISGVIADSIGWPYMFYVAGAAGIIWSIFWLCFGGETPYDIKYISIEEANFINDSCGLDLKTHSDLVIPWKKILTSIPVLCLTLAYFCDDFGFTFLLTNIPTYIKYVLNYDIKSNGLLSALPYVFNFISVIGSGFISDFLINNNYVTVTRSRKIFSSVMFWGAMVILIGIAFVNEDHRTIAVVLLTSGVTVSGAACVSIYVNHIDLTPNFAGTVMGLTNCVAAISSIISPLVAGVVVKDKENLGQWQIMFFITAGINFFTNVMFLIFGTAITQAWN